MSNVHYKNVHEITGDILKIIVPSMQAAAAISVPRLDDLALIHTQNGLLLSQITHLEKEIVTLQVYGGTKGLSTDASVTFLGHPMKVTYSPNILGRVFNGVGQSIDGGPKLDQDDKTPVRTATVNPTRRTLASKMIRTNIPMIDVFNCYQRDRAHDMKRL
ncbi:V-type ATPase subunit B [Legionella sainthelensi]|uniref:hypothetical protein n=1 Tax=Legionella sainthelensi TaxID=28087 RepID=UPI000F6E0072|nr:hypothetical protein [Legionella sainthelensi]VEB32993.1 V-type ATPase subunit B [Legionella sainthelensi]